MNEEKESHHTIKYRRLKERKRLKLLEKEDKEPRTGVSDLTQLNYQFWSCNKCLNFPFLDLDDVLFDDILTTDLITKPKDKKVNFDNNFEKFQNLDKPNINFRGKNSHNELLNFEYYQIKDFSKLKKGLDSNSLSFFIQIFVLLTRI